MKSVHQKLSNEVPYDTIPKKSGFRSVNGSKLDQIMIKNSFSIFIVKYLKSARHKLSKEVSHRISLNILILGQ